jgi:hypothetical protein
MTLLVITISILFLIQAFLIFGQEFATSIFGQSHPPNDIQYNNISKYISGITCDKTEHLVYHNHTMLMLKNNNQNITIPAGIGIIPNNCIFWLHTHDDSGIIHIESPSQTSFTLGQFLQVWNNFDNSSIPEELLKNEINNNISILFANGSNIHSAENAKDITLQNNAIISINLTNQTTK